MTRQQLNLYISTAIDIATKAHAGQKRKGGKDYITHVMAVVNSVRDELKPIAALHDVIEDTNITLDDLKRQGVPKYVLDAVDLLTKRKHQDYFHYLQNLSNNAFAVVVKIADIKHNLNDMPGPKQKEKYLKALEFFKSKGFDVV